MVALKELQRSTAQVGKSAGQRLFSHSRNWAFMEEWKEGKTLEVPLSCLLTSHVWSEQKSCTANMLGEGPQ